jgi:hypothetical protein
MEIILIILFSIILILIAIGAYYNIVLFEIYEYKRKTYERKLATVTKWLWRVVFLFIILVIVYEKKS